MTGRHIRKLRIEITGELGAGKTCPPSSEGAGKKRTSVRKQRAFLRPYLDGLEKKLREAFPKTRKQGSQAKVNLVRFADDFIVTGSSRELLEQQVKPIVVEFLQ